METTTPPSVIVGHHTVIAAPRELESDARRCASWLSFAVLTRCRSWVRRPFDSTSRVGGVPGHAELLEEDRGVGFIGDDPKRSPGTRDGNVEDPAFLFEVDAQSMGEHPRASRRRRSRRGHSSPFTRWTVASVTPLPASSGAEDLAQPGVEGGGIGMEVPKGDERPKVVGVRGAVSTVVRGVEVPHRLIETGLGPDRLEDRRRGRIGGRARMRSRSSVKAETLAAGLLSEILPARRSRPLDVSLFSHPLDDPRRDSSGGPTSGAHDVGPGEVLATTASRIHARAAATPVRSRKRVPSRFWTGMPSVLSAACTGASSVLTLVSTAISDGLGPVCQMLSYQLRGREHRDRTR